MSISKKRKRGGFFRVKQIATQKNAIKKRKLRMSRVPVKLKEDTVNFIVQPFVPLRSINFEFKSGRERHSTVMTNNVFRDVNK